MILARSPTLTFAFFFSLASIALTILTVTQHDDGLKNPQQILVIFPPLNCLFIFLCSVTWIERRFRLSYMPFICLLILLASSLTLTCVSALSLSTGVITYVNLIYYSLFSIFLLIILITVVISYSYGSLVVHRYRNMMTVEQQGLEPPTSTEPLRIDQYIVKSKGTEQLILFMSRLPGRRVRHDIRSISADLAQMHVNAIVTLNEIKELSFMNMTDKNVYNMETFSSHVKRANIEHLIYPIRDRFIPKSISDYMQFLYTIILYVNRSERNRLLVHCMGGMGRTGMTVVCLELIYGYIVGGEEEQGQRFFERFCHYPFLLTHCCRVCNTIAKVRQARKGTIHNPLQIIFAHEFYARLKSASYMQQIKGILQHNETLLSNRHEEFVSTSNAATANNHQPAV